MDTAEASEQRCRLPRIPFRFSAVANRLENSPVARIDRADECASALLAVARCPRVLRRREMDQHPHRHVTRNVATETTTMAKSGMNKIEIRAIPSQYTDGAWSRVIVRLGWCLDGTQVSITEERSAQAVGHGWLRTRSRRPHPARTGPSGPSHHQLPRRHRDRSDARARLRHRRRDGARQSVPDRADWAPQLTIDNGDDNEE